MVFTITQFVCLFLSLIEWNLSRFITQIFSVILLYSNPLCQLFLFAVIQHELTDVEDLLVSERLLGSGRLAGSPTTGGKPPH